MNNVPACNKNGIVTKNLPACEKPAVENWDVKQKKSDLCFKIAPGYLEHWSFLANDFVCFNFHNNLNKGWNCILDSPISLASSFLFRYDYCFYYLRFPVQGYVLFFWFLETFLQLIWFTFHSVSFQLLCLSPTVISFLWNVFEGFSSVLLWFFYDICLFQKDRCLIATQISLLSRSSKHSLVSFFGRRSLVYLRSNGSLTFFWLPKYTRLDVAIFGASAQRWSFLFGKRRSPVWFLSPEFLYDPSQLIWNVVF